MKWFQRPRLGSLHFDTRYCKRKPWQTVLKPAPFSDLDKMAATTARPDFKHSRSLLGVQAERLESSRKRLKGQKKESYVA